MDPLTPHQRAVIDEVHDDAKALIKTLSHGFSESIVNTLTKIIGEVIKLVQAAKATKDIRGADKKRVVIEVIRLLITDIVEDEKERSSILATFDEISEASINVMIYVSHGLQEINHIREQAEGAIKSMEVEVKVVENQAHAAKEEVSAICGCLSALTH